MSTLLQVHACCILKIDLKSVFRTRDTEESMTGIQNMSMPSGMKKLTDLSVLSLV